MLVLLRQAKEEEHYSGFGGEEGGDVQNIVREVPLVSSQFLPCVRLS